MKISTSFFTTASCLALVAAKESRHSDVQRLLATDAAAWTYRETAENGSEPLQPMDWSLEYQECAGDRQSPINLAAAYVTQVEPDKFGLMFSPKSCPSNLYGFLQNDHSWKVDFAQCLNNQNYASTLEFEGQSYELLQMHVHSPSEHTFGGGEEDGELHFVHVNANGSGNLLVVGVMFSASHGFANSELEQYWSHIQGTSDELFVSSPYDMLPASPTYFTYLGSLTTPPCSEIVTWVVMSDKVKISTTQLETFRYAVQHFPGSTVSEECNTNRPPMPLNERHIYHSG